MGIAKRRSASSLTLAAPIKGWNARDAVANMDPLFALIMDNAWPTTSDVMLRKGYTAWATGLPTQVETLLVYNSPTASEMFAVCAGGVYDVTSAGAVGAAVVSGLVNSRLQHVNMSNAGGNYLVAVNGEDAPLLYDGATWSNTAITGVTQANLVHVNLFKNRLWFVEKDTLKAWYLGVDAIAGAASQFNLQSIASRGGYLMAMATWTIDAGEGVDDYAVFITSEGEVIVYLGTDPSSATTWALKGVWQLGSPLGRRCFTKFAGDLLLACADGVQPMSKALQSSRVNPQVSLTSNIQGAMSEAASLYADNFGWELDFCARDSRVLLNVPSATGYQQQYAMNTITGAWGRFTGVAANCWEQFNDVSYFGGDGYVGKFWDGYSDNGATLTADVLQAFSTFGSPGATKRWTLAQLILACSGPPSVNAAINVDYDTSLYSAPAVIAPVVYGEWDLGTWDYSLWGGALSSFQSRVGLSGVGKAAAMRLSMSGTQIEQHWQATNFVYEVGGLL